MPKHPAPWIPNDELEYSRIQLENNLRNSEATFHLSSETDAESYESGDDVESVEYPRHNSAPPYNDFPSFDHRARDYLAEEDAPGHGWSYRTGDDYEEGINPYGGESLSTVAHHASAVTLSAGLAGRGARRDISLSGAEYDPDRPLNDIIEGVNSKFSVFDTPSRSKRVTPENITNDPLVVEDTAELDHILETGAQQSLNRSVRMASPVTSGSSSHSESDHGHVANTTVKNRPKLSDALRNVALSPKRPRSPQTNRSIPFSPKQPTSSSASRGNQRPSISHVPTPRPGRRSNIFPPHASAPQQPELILQPPTPSSAGSKFTRMAHGLAKEIEYEKGQLKASTSTKRAERSRSASMPLGNNLFRDGAGQSHSATDKPTVPPSSQRNKSRIQLPDVTGITNAIESPAKLTAEYCAYRAESQIRETENRLFKTLNTVQKKIQQLEEENGISRRRVRELELELEDCKREVARERTRLIEQEEILKQQQASLRAAKGKARARDLSADTSQLHERYKEVVEEKKALEVLISSLRTQLARLTSELSLHRELLTELRTLRDADSATLRGKSSEIVRLKNEVERLAGEVEVLRDVVEEGLRERRAAKEASIQQDTGDYGAPSHHDPGADHSEDEDLGHELDDEEDEEEDEDPETETEDASFSSVSGGSRVKAMDRTMRTDRATEGSSQTHDTRGARFIGSAEFERISAEIDDRRSDRSGSINLSQFSHTRSPEQSPSPTSRRNRTVDTSVVYDMSTFAKRASSPDPISDSEDELEDVDIIHEPGPSTRPDRVPHPNRRHQTEPEASFPKIRGKRLERLFFAAPEHDARTCTTCNRRRRESDEHPVSVAWRTRRAARRTRSRRGSNDQEDEGFAEPSQELEQPQSEDKGKRRERSLQDINEVRFIARQEGLPPQTIVARIIRELEDDFTHYKSIYIELADQYKEMDAASNVAKRNTLAQHLREVVDVLEQKGDQIASLYDLLSFKNKAGGAGNRTKTS